MSHSVHSPTTLGDVVRLALGWGAFIILRSAGPALDPPMPTGALVGVLVGTTAVVVACAFGVVKHAEALARRLGDPYGTLVLTLSVVLIEVILIAAVMLGPGDHATIARDSVMAVSMIIMNLVIGLSLMLGGLRHGGMTPNRAGTSAYLSMVIALASLAFALPAFIGEAGAYTAGQSAPIIVVTLGVYAFFLCRQTGAQAADFREIDRRLLGPANPPAADHSARLRRTLDEHRREILRRIGLLTATMIPIVLLSHDLAALLDHGLSRAGAPFALAGALIAMIVFLPESLTSVRAAMSGEAQRVNNLCHGGLVSTVGLTIPVVLIIGLVTDQTVILAESPANLLLLTVTMALAIAALSAEKATAVHGAAHLVVFAAYGVTLFS